MLPGPDPKSEQAAGRAATAAAFCGAFLIAAQVAGRATRDALFLSNFPVTSLPVMLIVASLASIAAVLAASRLMARTGPARFTPRAFALSGALLLGEWILARFHGRIASVVLYLHAAVLGSILISAFWSLVNERFDPRTARRRIARITLGATVGGLVGGVTAERAGVWLSVADFIPFLAVFHLLAAWQSLRIRGGGWRPRSASREDGGGTRARLRLFRDNSYLRDLSIFVLTGTAAAAMIDYVFKAQAAARIGDGEDLLRFFALFYTVVSLATFAVQAGLGRRVLDRLGLTGSVASLPAVVAGGGAALLALPGLAGAGVLRALESIFRSSLFRSGYELLYTPIKPSEKRAAKPIVDVGFDRFGDMVGGGLIRLVLAVAATAAAPVLIVLAVLLSLLSLLLVRRLHLGYVKALEKSLISQADRAGEAPPGRSSGSTILQSVSDMNLSSLWDREEEEEEEEGVGAEEEDGGGTGADEPEPMVEDLVALRSGDPELVRSVLRRRETIDPALAPQVICLLAWDEVKGEATRALGRIGPRIVGLLIDRLLDPEEEFAIRRRIPRVLGCCPDRRAADGLQQGLRDRRFEVRYQCGLALSRMTEKNPELEVDREEVIDRIAREARVDRKVWESQRLLDIPVEEDDSDPEFLFVDEVLRTRSSRSLEHVFTLMSLVFPREPLRICFRGLHTDDDLLRGTALEYLESVLPESIRENLWPLLEDRRVRARDGRRREQVLADLLRSNQSIELNLEELRKRRLGDRP